MVVSFSPPFKIPFFHCSLVWVGACCGFVLARPCDDSYQTKSCQLRVRRSTRGQLSTQTMHCLSWKSLQKLPFVSSLIPTNMGWPSMTPQREIWGFSSEGGVFLIMIFQNYNFASHNYKVPCSLFFQINEKIIQKKRSSFGGIFPKHDKPPLAALALASYPWFYNFIRWLDPWGYNIYIYIHIFVFFFWSLQTRFL